MVRNSVAAVAVALAAIVAVIAVVAVGLRLRFKTIVDVLLFSLLFFLRFACQLAFSATYGSLRSLG